MYYLSTVVRPTVTRWRAPPATAASLLRVERFPELGDFPVGEHVGGVRSDRVIRVHHFFRTFQMALAAV